LGVPNEKIDTETCKYDSRVRQVWLSQFAGLISDDDKNACVAELGVYRGDFACAINRNFPARTLYLFDTFEGFTEVDISGENYETDSRATNFSDTSINLVMSKMPYPDRIVVKKGHFPQTTEGVEERFCFVNLDCDLYLPTLEALKFFSPRMTENGVILVHDYFGHWYQESIKRAIDEFLSAEAQKGNKHRIFPIGDLKSIALIRF
jgi:hypothetical protein